MGLLRGVSTQQGNDLPLSLPLDRGLSGGPLLALLPTHGYFY